MTAAVPAVSVVIPTHNRCALLRALLARLADQEPGTPPFELVVVADGCTDGTRTMLADLSLPLPLTIVELPGSGPAAARNEGAAAATGELLIFIDDDVEPGPGFVAAHAADHRLRPGGVLLGPYPPLPEPSNDRFRTLADRWWSQHFERIARPGHRFAFWDVLTGNLSLSRGLWRELGGLDPQFAHAREDYEFGIRLIKRGVPIAICTRASALHHEQQTTTLRSSLRRALEEGRSDGLILLKHPDMAAALRIGRFVQRRPSRMRVAARGFRIAGPALDRIARLGPLVLAGIGAMGLRHLHDRFLLVQQQYHYLRGAADSLHARQPAELPAPPPPTALEIDLAEGIEQAEARMTDARPRAVQLTLNGAEFGRLGDDCGCEAWHGGHLRAALSDWLTRSFLQATLVDRAARRDLLRLDLPDTARVVPAPIALSMLNNRSYTAHVWEDVQHWVLAFQP